MALSTAVVPNNLGIKPMMLVKHPNFTNPVYRTKKKLMLHSTATPGAPAQNFFPNWNSPNAGASVEFVLDDTQILQFLPIGKNGEKCLKTWHCGSGKNGSGNTVYIATEVCEPTEAQLIPINWKIQKKGGSSNKTYSIKRIQMELAARGFYKGAVDGKYGDTTEAAVRAFQQSLGWTGDGIVGPKTRTALANRTGSYLIYDVKAATPFFNKAYDNAVNLFAFLCDYVGAKPNEIICHQEGYRMGIASNHSDVEHFFPLHGKSMDDFRADVARKLNGTYSPLSGAAGTTPIDPLQKAYLAGLDVLEKAGIVGDKSYWHGCCRTEKVDDANVMALLRQSAQWFCRYSHHWGAHALQAAGVIMEDACEYQHKTYTYDDVLNIIKCMGHSMAGTFVVGYEDIVAAMVERQIINTPDYWLGLKPETVLNQEYVKALVRQCGAFLCSQSYKFAVEVIAEPVKMNSKDFWLGGVYNFTNTMYLVKALAEAIEPLL